MDFKKIPEVKVKVTGIPGGARGMPKFEEKAWIFRFQGNQCKKGKIDWELTPKKMVILKMRGYILFFGKGQLMELKELNSSFHLSRLST